MQYSTSFLVAALASIVAAQNPFSFTSLTSIDAGSTFNITWSPSTGTSDTITLILRQGDSANLDTVKTIAAGIQNTGSYLWQTDDTLVNGDDYAFEIVDDGNTAIVNYSNQFSINSPNTATPTPSTASSTGSSTTTLTSATTITMTTTNGSSTGTVTSTSGVSSSTSSGTKTTSKSTSTGSSTSSSASSTITSINGGASMKVGSGLVAVIGAAMMAL